ncbi:MAG: leucine-rich repeat domain-containing protein [Lachnospiraceae bacterium]|nr:leucine-rich repeat domain-containing protein [Lachnospiraceae bacterium]
MKKRYIYTVIIIAGLLGGCAGSATSTTESSSVALEETNIEVQGKGGERDTIVSDAGTTEEDFEIEILQDGTVEIKRYIGEETEVIIPETIDGKEVTVIGGFKNRDDLTSVIMPDTVKKITTNAFLNCINLSYVKLSINIEEIEEYAFDGQFTEIVLPETLKKIGDYAFSGVSLETITLPPEISSIGAGTFSQTSLETVTIPGNVRVIEEGAFSDCKQLKEVVIEDGVEVIEESAFEKCTALEKVIIPVSVTDIDMYTFWRSEKVIIVVEPGSYAEEVAKERGIPVLYT